jgi:hypothetical protein
MFRDPANHSRLPALNDAIPKSEWGEDFNGNPKGPWQLDYVLFLVDPADGTKLICCNGTAGQRIAYESLKERAVHARREGYPDD